MLQPKDYSPNAIYNEQTRSIMEKIKFEHGGPEYDKLYPEGIPTSVKIKTKYHKIESGIV
jgi:2-methylcitrate dehydratase